MFLLSREEQIGCRILVVIVLVCGILYLFFSPNRVSLKKIAVEKEDHTEIEVVSDDEVVVVEKGKTKPNRVIINQSSYEELLACPGIGESKATQIVKERQNSKFTDWQDFQNRIKGIATNQVDILKDAGVRLDASESVNDL